MSKVASRNAAPRTMIVGASLWLLAGCSSTALDTTDGGGPDSAITHCSYGGNMFPVGATFPANDGCNTCTCQANGQVACTLLGCVPNPICSVDHTYSFRSDGGLRPYADSSVLRPPALHELSRDTFMNALPATCSRQLACAGDGGTGDGANEFMQAVSHPDVVQALQMTTPPFYGADPRPVDGSVLIFQRDDGRGFTLGSGDVPAGLRALQAVLTQITADTLASPACANLPDN